MHLVDWTTKKLTHWESHDLTHYPGKTFSSSIKEVLLRTTFSARRRKVVHFIHIRKTGGTAIKSALQQRYPSAQSIIVLHKHRTTLKNIPKGDRVFFLRDPVARFVSGFLCRLNESRPAHYWPWLPEERLAFERFPTPNALALALYSDSPGEREAAQNAVLAVGHLKYHYSYWLIARQYLESRLDDIIFIGFQEALSQGFENLKVQLNLPVELVLPKDDAIAHRTPTLVDKRLTGEAVANLKRWYADDYELYEYCKSLASSKGFSI